MNRQIPQPMESSPLLHPSAFAVIRDDAKPKTSVYSVKLLKGVAVVLLLSEMFERTTFYAIRTYAIGLTNNTRFDDATGTDVRESVLNSIALKLFTAVGWFLPVIGGAVGDAKKRRKHVLLLGCVLYLVGALMITWGHSSDEDISAVLMYICLVLVVLGMACVKSNIPAMGGMYWLEGSAPDTPREQDRDISLYFHWYVCFTNIGAFLGVFPSPWFWEVAPYVALVTALMNLVTITIVCFIAPPLPVDEEDTGKILISTLKQLCPQTCEKYCHIRQRRLHIQEDVQSLAEKNIESLGQLMMFFGPFILFITTYLQLYSAFGILGGGYPWKTYTIELNGATYYVIDDLTIVFLTPIFVCVLPWVHRRCSSTDISYHKVVIGAGICLLSSLVGGVAAMFRKETHQLYMIPQFVLLGIAEMFFQSGGYEHAFRNAPNTLKGFTVGMFVATFGVGYGIELIFMVIFSGVRSNGYPWYPLSQTDISASIYQGHDGLQYYIFVTAGLIVFSMLLMYISAKELNRRKSEVTEERNPRDDRVLV